MALSLVLRSAIKIPGKILSPRLSACGVFPLKITSADICNSSFRISSDYRKPNSVFSRVAISNITKPGVRYLGSKSDFRLMWTIERILSLGLVGLIPATIAFPSPILDNACAIIVGLHLHWGLEAVCQDYVRPAVVGNFVANAGVAATYAISILIITGLLYFNYNDIGIGKGVRKLWAIKE